MAKPWEWIQAAAETVSVGDGIIRRANGANYICSAVEVRGEWVTLAGSCTGYEHYRETYQRQELVWVCRKD